MKIYVQTTRLQRSLNILDLFLLDWSIFFVIQRKFCSMSTVTLDLIPSLNIFTSENISFHNISFVFIQTLVLENKLQYNKTIYLSENVIVKSRNSTKYAINFTLLLPSIPTVDTNIVTTMH